jgi:hypothetical protein
MMKRSILSFLTIFAAAVFTTAAYTDVKVKSKQTVAGQSHESTTYIKGKRQRSESFGGMVNITQCDLKRGVQINSNSQTYMVTPFAPTTQTTTRTTSAPASDKNGVVQTGGQITMTITTKDTGERKQMFGYTARHLIITMETVSSTDACTKSDMKMQTDGWYIDAAFALDCDNAYSGYGANNYQKGGCRDSYSVKNVGTAKRGFPVYEKTTMFDAAGRETMTMVNEVVELSQATLDAGLFEIPAGFREVKDASEMYGAPRTTSGASAGTSSAPFDQNDTTDAGNNGVVTAIAAAKQPGPEVSAIGPKKEGVIRIGIAGVKTGAVGEGISSADLSVAVRNSLIQHLKVPNVEVVALESKLASGIEAEAKTKECDYVAYLTASHKKGGGGFGMFKALAPMISSVAPIAGAGGYIATQAVITTATISGQVKNKDEITLDVKLNKTGGAPAFEKVLKARAKSNGDDIISQVVEQASQGIVDSLKVR